MAEITLGTLVNTKLTMNQQRRQWHPGQSVSRRLRKASLPLYSVLVGHIWSIVCSTGLPTTTKVMKGLEHLSYKDRLKGLGLFSLEKSRLRRILSMCINK